VFLGRDHLEGVFLNGDEVAIDLKIVSRAGPRGRVATPTIIFASIPSDLDEPLSGMTACEGG
jgi:hypothetical protein